MTNEPAEKKMTREEIMAEERLTLGGIEDIVTVGKVAGKYVTGEEYYLHMAKRAKQLADIERISYAIDEDCRGTRK